MIVIGDGVFAGIPKTGSTWVRAILRQLGGKSVLGPHTDPGRALLVSALNGNQAGIEGKSFFTFVRHPATWYRSAWMYFYRDRRHGSVPVIRGRGLDWCGRDRPSYETFLERVLERNDPMLSEVYALFCGPENRSIRVARIEDAHYQLGMIVSALAGIDRQDVNKVVRATGPKNQSDNVPPLNVELSNLVCEIEHKAMRRFNYRPVCTCGALAHPGRQHVENSKAVPLSCRLRGWAAQLSASSSKGNNAP